MTAQQSRPSGFPGGLHLKQGPSEPTPQEVAEDDELVSFVGPGGRPMTTGVESNRFTKTGKPDRRFKGQRDLPDEEVINPGYRRANVGQVIDDVHLTMDGTPDRRFKENRNISDQDAEIMKANLILAKYQGRTGVSRH